MSKKLPEGKWELITPKKAALLLDNNPVNRKMRPGVAEKYAINMKNGDWTQNPQPIMIYDSGEVADGQHRLWAVVDSGISIQMFVMRGVDKAVALNIDTGQGRTFIDNARLSGFGLPVTHRIMAMMRVFHFGTRNTGRALSNAVREKLITAYWDHLFWAADRVTTKKIFGTAVVCTAVARAHQYEKDLDRLSEFCEMLGSGLITGEQDHAVVALRTYLINGGPNLSYDSHDLFLKSMNAIKYFMKGKPLSVIKGTKEEAYPLKSPVAV